MKTSKFVSFCTPRTNNENYKNSQIILSPNYVITTLRSKLKEYTSKDYLLLTGDPAIIGVACSIVSDTTNGKFNLLKWDKQERRYYPVEIDLYKK